MRNITQRASLVLLSSLLSGVAHAAGPAPMTYQMPNGKSASVLLMTGVGSDGKPLVQAYTGPDGKSHSPLVQAQICSVESGTPYLCAAADMSNPALILNASGVPVSSGTWPTIDPLVSGQAWQNGGVMMLSTGSAAKPTFDGSGLSNVAILNASGQVTAPINTAGNSEFGGDVALLQGKALTFHGPSGSTAASAYMYGDSSGNVAVSGGMTVPTLTVSTSASVPDVANNDVSTAALNTESANSRFLSVTDASNFIGVTTLSKYQDTASIAAMYLNKTDAASTYLTIDDAASTYLTAATAADTYATTSALSSYLLSADAVSTYLSKTDTASTYATVSALTSYLTTATAASTYAPLASPALTGTPTSTTPATTDNSTAIATTAFVNNAFQAVEYSVQGDISTSGSAIQIPFGTSGLYAKFAYTGSGSASMTFCSSSGTLSPVDIRRNSIWGGSGVETYTLDNGSVDTSCVTADSTVYTQSQDSSAYFIRVGGQVYFLTVWASNNGARAFMGVHKMI